MPRSAARKPHVRLTWRKILPLWEKVKKWKEAINKLIAFEDSSFRTVGLVPGTWYLCSKQSHPSIHHPKQSQVLDWTWLSHETFILFTGLVRQLNLLRNINTHLRDVNDLHTYGGNGPDPKLNHTIDNPNLADEINQRQLEDLLASPIIDAATDTGEMEFNIPVENTIFNMVCTHYTTTMKLKPFKKK